MSKAHYLVEDAVLAAFETACQQQDFEVAEHLLRALEVIAHREGEDHLESAMLTLTRSLLEKRHYS